MNRECAGLVMSAPPNGALQLTWPGHLVYIHPDAVEPSEAVARLPPAQARPFTVFMRYACARRASGMSSKPDSTTLSMVAPAASSSSKTTSVADSPE